MPTRKVLLQQNFIAKAAMRDQDLPDDQRAQWKKLADQSDVLLGLRDALERKKAKEAGHR